MVVIPSSFLVAWAIMAGFLFLLAIFRTDFTLKEAISALFVITGAVGSLYLIVLFVIRFAQVTPSV